MNRSWSNSSNSPGFVYFNQTPTRNPADTSEFLSLDDNNSPSPKVNHRFSPSNYGSPQFHSSPRKFNLRNTYRHSGGNQGNRSFNRNGSNNSFNSNFNHSRGNNKHGNVNNSKSFTSDGKRNVTDYYDHTSTLDPWADLQKELDKTREEEEEAKKASKSESTTENEQEENSSSTGGESDSDDSEESPITSNTIAGEETT